MSINVLKAVWGKQSGYVFIPRRLPDKTGGRDTWDEGKAYKFPDEWGDIVKRLKQSAMDGWDTYWCPLVFSKPKRLKENVLEKQRLLWADLDFADPTALGSLSPSIAWKSSDERFQGLWILDKWEDIKDIEPVNRDLSYHIEADKGGWDVTQVLRVPGSPNHKYDPPQQGKLLWAESRLFNLAAVKDVVSKSEPTTTEVKTELSIDELLKGFTIPRRTMDLLHVDKREVEVGDRSDRLWEIETSLLEAGVPVLTIVAVVKMCPWNKFKGRKGEDDQIYHEVLKADEYVKRKVITPEPESPIELTEEEKEKLDDLWAVPFSVFTSKSISKPEWLIEGIWQTGTYGMIAGEPKTYKSVQATDIALSVASGTPYLNVFPVSTPGTVLYVQEENGEQTVQDRVFKIASSKGLVTSTSDGWQLQEDLPIYFSNNYGIDLTQPKSRELLEQTIKELKPVLVILDPLYMMLGQVDENNATEVGAVLRWLTYLRNTYGVSILVCHHYNKGNGTTRGGQRVRGSSAFHAWVESAIYVKTTPELYTVMLEREFRAFPSMPDLTLKVELGVPGELLYRPQMLEELPSAVEEFKGEEVLTLLSSMPRTIEELSALAKVDSVQLQRIIAKLVKDNKIMKVMGGGRGKKTTYCIK